MEILQDTALEFFARNIQEFIKEDKIEDFNYILEVALKIEEKEHEQLFVKGKLETLTQMSNYFRKEN